MPNTITRGRPRQRGRPPKRQMGPQESGGPPVAPSGPPVAHPVAPSGPQWPPSPHSGGYSYSYRGPGHYPYQQVIPRAEYSRGPNPYQPHISPPHQQSVIRPRPSSAPSRAIRPDYQPITQPSADYRRFTSQQPRGAINQPSPILYQQLTAPLPTFSESFKEFMTHRAPAAPGSPLQSLQPLQSPAVPGNPVQPPAVLPPPPPAQYTPTRGEWPGSAFSAATQDTEGDVAYTQDNTGRRGGGQERVVSLGRAFTTSREGGSSMHSITALPVPKIALRLHTSPPVTIMVTPDSGASSTILAAATAKQLGLQVDSSRRVRIQDAQGQLLKTEGIALISAALPGGRTRQLEIVVCQSLSEECLLSFMDQILVGCLEASWPHKVHPEDPTDSRYIESQQDPRVRRRLRILRQSQQAYNGQALSASAEIDEDSLTYSKSPLPPMPEDFKKIFEEFDDCMADHLLPHNRMRAPPLDFKVKPGTIPYKTYAARPIPIHMLKPARKLWDKMIEAKVIRVLAPNESSEWLSNGFFVPKPGQFDEDGTPKVRAVVDWKHLNSALVREAPHPFETGRNIWQRIDADARVYVKLDLVSSYWQCPLTPAASRLTAFICAFGRAVFLSAGMGISLSSDAKDFFYNSAVFFAEFA